MEVNEISTNTEFFFQNLVNPYKIWIVITIFKYIEHQTEFHLVLNLSQNGNYNQNLVWINKIPKTFLCVYMSKILKKYSKILKNTQKILPAVLQCEINKKLIS